MNRKGFTVIEMLLVIVILAILAGISLYGFEPIFSKRRVADELRKLEFALKRAQALALSSSSNVAVKFQSDKYTLCRIRPNCTCLPDYQQSYEIEYGTLTAPSTLGSCFYFKSTGYPSVMNSSSTAEFDFQIKYKSAEGTLKLSKEGRVSIE